MQLFKRIAAVAAAIVLLGILGAGALSWHHGYRMYAVRTGSMSPAFRPGDLVIDGPPRATYAAGEVITFRSRGGGGSAVTTHRVHEVRGAVIETQGDANLTPDVATLGLDDVVGRVVGTVSRAGYVLVFFQQPTGAPALMAGLFALALLWGLFFPGDEAGPVRRGPGPVLLSTPS